MSVLRRPATLLCVLLLAACDTARPDPDEGKTIVTVLFAYTSQVRAEAGDVEALGVE